MVIQTRLFHLKKRRRAASDDSKLASSPHVDEDMSESRSEQSDMALNAHVTVNRRSTSQQVRTAF